MKSRCRGKLFIVSGPSGVGKTTVVEKFLEQYGSQYNIDRAVTYTTKQPRFNEQNGIDYHFIPQKEFEDKIRDGFFLEWSSDYGACYGTPRSILNEIESGVSLILVIDRSGAKQILKSYPLAVLIWVTVSSLDIIRDRLVNRKTETQDQVDRRLRQARKEIDEELNHSIYNHCIANDDLKCAVEGLLSIFSQEPCVCKST